MKRQLPRGKFLIVTTALAFGGLAASAAAVQLAQAAAIAAGAAAAAPGIARPAPLTPRVRRTEGLLRSVIGAVVHGTRRRENPS